METARAVLATNRRHAGWPRLDSRLSPPVPSNKLMRMAATADFRTSPMVAMPQRADEPGVFRGGRSAAAWCHLRTFMRHFREGGCPTPTSSAARSGPEADNARTLKLDPPLGAIIRREHGRDIS